MEKITFAPGAPVEVALKFPTGKNVPGKFGEQVLFTATNDTVFYLDPEPASDVERRISELGIRTGEPFRLTKIKHPRGGGCSFHVDRLSNESDLERTLTRSIENRSRQEAPQPSKEKTPPTSTTTAPIEPPTGRVSAQQEIQPERNHNAPMAAKLMAAFAAAIEALAEAQAYATRRGLGITFSSEDVRCVAISAFIQDGRR
jgi:Fe2+ transport system protein FeoA